MEIDRWVGDKIERLGVKILTRTVVKDLGITKEPVNKMGAEELAKAFDQYFENLMRLPPNERQVFVINKLEEIPRQRRPLARRIIQNGIQLYLKKQEEEKSKDPPNSR